MKSGSLFFAMLKGILPGFFFLLFLGLFIASCSDKEVDELKKRIDELEARGPDTVYQDIYKIDTIVTVINQIDTVIHIDTVYIEDIQFNVDTIYIYDPVFFYGLWVFNERLLIIDDVDSSTLSVGSAFLKLTPDSIEFMNDTIPPQDGAPPFSPPGSGNVARIHPIVDQYYDGGEFCIVYDYNGIENVLVRLSVNSHDVNSVYMRELLPPNRYVIGPLNPNIPPPCSCSPYPPGEQPPPTDPTYDDIDTTRNFVFHYRLKIVD